MVKVDVGSLGAQASSVSSSMSARVSALTSAISALENFSQNNDNLKGEAYTQAMTFGTGTLVPLLQGMILFSEGISERASRLRDLYTSLCGDESLDSTVLENAIYREELALRSASNMMRILERDEYATPYAISRQRTYTDSLRSQLASSRQKLEKLMAFDRQSQSIFRDIEHMETAVTTGLSEVGSVFNNYSTTKSFALPNGNNPEWKKRIKSEWESREEKANVIDYASEALGVVNKAVKNVQKGYVASHIRQIVTNKGVTQVVYKHGNKYWDELFDAVKFINKNRAQDGKLFSFLSSTGKTVRGGKYAKAFFDDFGLLYPEAILKGHPINWKAIGKNLKGMTLDKVSDFIKAPVSKKLLTGTGISSLISDFKAVKSAKGLGKAIPFINAAAGAFEVGVGLKENDAIAKKEGLKRGSLEYGAAQISGVGIDVAKVGVDTAVSTVAYSAGATIATVGLTALGVVGTAPVIAGVGVVVAGVTTAYFIGGAVSKGTAKVAKEAKKLVTKGIKAVSDGMKNFGKSFRKVFG